MRAGDMCDKSMHLINHRQHEDIGSLMREQQTKHLSTQRETSEYVVPVRLTAIQRRLYHTLLLENAETIETFCKDPSGSPASKAAIADLTVALQKVVVHPLLLADSMPDTKMTISEEAWYLTQASSKFELIVDFLEQVRTQDLRIAILYKGERIRHIWTSILQGLELHFMLATDNSQQSTQDTSGTGLEVVLLEAISQGPVDVAFDLAFSLAGTERVPGTPNFLLIANNSVEHVSRQITDPLTQLSTLANLSENVGVCSQDAGALVRKIVNFLCGMPFETEGLSDLAFPASQYDEISYEASDDGAPAAKRQRSLMSESQTQPMPKILITKINGMEVHTEENMPESTPFLPATGEDEESLANRQLLTPDIGIQDVLADVPTQSSLQTQFISPIHLEKMPSQTYEPKSKQIWSKPSADQERIAGLEEDIERIMVRFDDLREECRELSEQKERALTQAAAVQKRFERAIEESRSAKQEKNELKLELERVKMPALPEESSPDYLSIENLRLKTEVEKLKKSADTKAQDFDFVRQQYQQASSAAVESANDVTSLRAQLEVLQNKVEGGLGYKLALLQRDAVEASLREEAENLTLRNNVLIEQLKRMRDERMVGRGRGENRRELVVNQDKKRATSASAEVGQRKKIEKVGTSRLSVASLITPSSDRLSTNFDPTSSPRAALQQMLRGQSQDNRSFGRERVPAKRPRTPMM